MKKIENREVICELKEYCHNATECGHGRKHRFTGRYACFTSFNPRHPILKRGVGDKACIESRCVLVEEKDESHS